MNPILVNIPEIIETPRLKLIMPMAGLGEALHEAMTDGYYDYVKWLAWPKKKPTIKDVELNCRKHHAEFIMRSHIRYIIIDKATNQVVGRCAYPPMQTKWYIPQFGVSYFIRKSQRSKGFAIESAQALAITAFRLYDAKKVSLHCDIKNVNSLKVPSSLNFELEFTQKGSWPSTDENLATINTYSVFYEQDLPELDISFQF